MKAVVFRAPGGPEVLEIADVPEPVPGPNEVLVDVRATALNRADLLQRRGRYPAPPGTSDILGLECSGVVAALGEGAARFGLGARVMALLPGGGYAARVVVHQDVLMAVPERLSFEQAAAVPEAFLTASEALLVEAELVAGQRLLVTAAASGIGCAAVQIGKQRGAFVIGSASTEKLAALSALGADLVLDRDRPDYVEALRAGTQERGVDAIVDLVGGSALARHQACLAPRGRLVLVGLLGGAAAPLDLSSILMKRQRICGLLMRSRNVAERIELVRRFERELWPALDTGVLSPCIDQIFPLADVALAHARMERNLNVGKIVLALS
ncbi:MAG TPA: NAD(P)H-quinone oxidoreductase [Polyangiaceae bacterium]|nr:NAD(P)H-quinone oxidoreductase [Polyangiaceae bacterium]